jgi:hypothetical protein
VSPELKPCPFCGGEADLKAFYANMGGFPSLQDLAEGKEPDGWSVQCRNNNDSHYASAGAFKIQHFVGIISQPNREAAIEAWNRRHA